MRDLELVIEPGERVLLLGASGSGKSTLLHALAGVLDREGGEAEGTLLIDGVEPESARGRAGLVLQDPDAQVILARVGDDVAFGCENLGVPREETWRRVGESLEAVGLDVPLNRSTSALSGGQRQRLALAGVLAMRPGLLLLDEPTANLDPAGVVEVRDAVGRVVESTRTTLVVVEHRVAVWRDLVDRVVVITPHGVIADGTPDAVLGQRGRELAATGIWVPEFPPALPPRRTRARPHTLLKAHDLAVGRDGMPVREQLEFAVPSSALLAVTGPNGSGKSTLGLTIAGLLPPVGGEVTAMPSLRDPAAGAPERDATRFSEPHRWRSRHLLTRIGTVFQDPSHQFLARTVRAELEVGPRALRLGERETAERVDELLERLRLTALERANPFTLSGGQQRRLSVATVLATRPRMLVLDEPTFGQDAVTWAELVAIIARLVDEGAGVVAMTHDRDFVTALADAELELA